MYKGDMFKSFCLCVRVWVCVLCVCQVPKEARKRHHIPRNWSYRPLGATIWVLRTEPWFSTNAVTALNPWGMSQNWGGGDTQKGSDLGDGNSVPWTLKPRTQQLLNKLFACIYMSTMHTWYYSPIHFPPLTYLQHLHSAHFFPCSIFTVIIYIS